MSWYTITIGCLSILTTPMLNKYFIIITLLGNVPPDCAPDSDVHAILLLLLSVWSTWQEKWEVAWLFVTCEAIIADMAVLLPAVFTEEVILLIGQSYLQTPVCTHCGPPSITEISLWLPTWWWRSPYVLCSGYTVCRWLSWNVPWFGILQGHRCSKTSLNEKVLYAYIMYMSVCVCVLRVH